MSDMKCPFCQQKLDYDDLLGSCINEHCEESFDMVGTESLWQKVINLKQELIRTRKALDVARSGLIDIFGYEGVPKYVAKHVRQVLDQIKNETALEQKDK